MPQEGRGPIGGAVLDEADRCSPDDSGCRQRSERLEFPSQGTAHRCPVIAPLLLFGELSPTSRHQFLMPFASADMKFNLIGKEPQLIPIGAKVGARKQTKATDGKIWSLVSRSYAWFD